MGIEEVLVFSSGIRCRMNVFVEIITFHKICFNEMRSNMPSGIDLLKMLLTLVVSNDMVDGSDSGGG